ncbi:MAG: serine/threonine-protein kinase [Bryobacterales bacterium]
MDHKLQHRARDIFLEACESTEAEREALLASACGNEAELRREVEALLAEFNNSGPLDLPAAAGIPISGDMFEPGASVAGRFEIVRLIGRGGMGEVYEAHDSTLNERVALKTISAEWLAEAGARSRFLREIRLARAVSHPNVCRIYDHASHETADGRVDLVSMKLLEGETLACRLETARLNLDEAMAMARALAEGLDAAHREGVLHLDLKPSNVIVVEAKGRAPTPVITDFGIARSAGAETATLTGETRPIGTPQYMAPELLRGKSPAPPLTCIPLARCCTNLPVGSARSRRAVHRRRLPSGSPAQRPSFPNCVSKPEAAGLPLSSGAWLSIQTNARPALLRSSACSTGRSCYDAGRDSFSAPSPPWRPPPHS